MPGSLAAPIQDLERRKSLMDGKLQILGKSVTKTHGKSWYSYGRIIILKNKLLELGNGFCGSKYFYNSCVVTTNSHFSSASIKHANANCDIGCCWLLLGYYLDRSHVKSHHGKPTLAIKQTEGFFPKTNAAWLRCFLGNVQIPEDPWDWHMYLHLGEFYGKCR